MQVRHVLQHGLSERLGTNAKVKVGHGGTLDPLATGVLVLGVGKGCRALGDYLAGGKRYRGVGLLGTATDTLDNSKGSVVVAEASWSHVGVDELRAGLGPLTGHILQVPPMFSALHHNGKRLYQLAREGAEVERPPRPTHVKRLKLLTTAEDWSSAAALSDAASHSCAPPGAIATIAASETPPLPPHSADGSSVVFCPKIPYFGLDIECGGGTYVRSLIDDLGVSVGSRSHMVWLERTGNGPFGLADCLPQRLWTFERLCTHVVACTNKAVDATRDREPEGGGRRLRTRRV